MNAITLHRIGHWFHNRGMGPVAWLIDKIIFLLFNSYLPSSARIGRGTKCAYGGIGMVVHADAVVGTGCILGQGITIGAKEGYAGTGRHAAPRIGNNIYIGAGSRILGGIVIGDSVIIGVNSVVLKDLPDHAIAAGAPARVVGTTPADYLAIRGSEASGGGER